MLPARRPTEAEWDALGTQAPVRPFLFLVFPERTRGNRAMPDLTETIQEAAEGPAAHAVDGESATARPIQDLIAADKYLSAKRHGSKGMNAILRQQMKAPSATGE